MHDGVVFENKSWFRPCGTEGMPVAGEEVVKMPRRRGVRTTKSDATLGFPEEVPQQHGPPVAA